MIKHIISLFTDRVEFPHSDSIVTPLLPDFGMIRRVKKGSKVSRYFRHIFEHNRFKRILGTNLAAFAIATSFIPTSNHVPVIAEEIYVTESLTTLPLVTTTKRSVQNPVNSIRITQNYNPYFHPGIDFDGEIGDKIMPIMEGFVIEVEYSRFGYGNSVIVKHIDKSESLYAHLNDVYVKRGDLVTLDDALGTMGETGRATGSHLHLEIRIDGHAINPYSKLPPAF